MIHTRAFRWVSRYFGFSFTGLGMDDSDISSYILTFIHTYNLPLSFFLSLGSSILLCVFPTVLLSTYIRFSLVLLLVLWAYGVLSCHW
ncbi:hypothetical protein DFP72DRAFT_533987 [Ephemerocybe angulata]|uniref:Uncharacterized protein n=1 Tax=Ephemerocybe angulata TaxID=980116 RepID=A0A8H6HNX5_9AGAR|nr:hypothetical protein DFP72DRAFT_533987 [Tulosesus angulatus]